ncbi:sodium/potassium/calcium exchanger 1-like isoform X3 [Nerophis lumbriciformis]|uniref:sodium/potassium/calcium exchanger 1-like isoform X3 n=1 Tax=Nerophis lumbriciformis TaxID=546530 RepID=UPI002AE05B4C|nr:sodium/potassium/calcium exchanger 1-like isoform X3 [Nerophis lumbriciformis]
MRTINVHPPQRRLRCSRVLFFISGVLLCFFYSLMLRARLSELSTQTNVEEEEGGDDVLQVEVREAIARNVTQEEVTLPASTPSTPVVIIVNRTDIEQCIYIEPQPPPTTITPTPRPPPQPPHRKGEYPEDIFSVEQRRQGWVVLHASGMIYMFVALAIVCDEFFVPALEVITKKLDISDDVAGATFMASGGSAPELFTSLIGVFVSHSNVGIGTIIGSAVFNILFVIGMCAIFSREVLHLTWWPLFRDVSFYTLDLIMLIVFFLDNMILWWESAMLVLGYVSYVCFMKFNSHIEQAVKTQLNKHMSIVQAWSTQDPDKERDPTTSPPPRPAAFAEKNKEDKSKHQSEPLQSPLPSSKPPDLQEDKDKLRVRPVLQRGGSSASLHNTLLRSTIFQLMIHTLDPLGEDEDRKPKCELSPAGASNIAGVKQSTTQPSAEEIKSMDNNRDGSQGSSGGRSDDGSGDGDSSNSGESEDDNGEDEGEEENAPLSLDWPESRRKQATYLVLLPIVFPLWLTLPDVRNPMSKKYFTFTFIGSILWIAVFSYLMVWWAHQVGETMGISEEIMGLTILAAGTSIPDLITSVIVARKGLGDMAVSSSVGSNIFDITVGLPVPWLLYSLLHNGAPVAVSSNGLFCAIVLLFLMLLFVTISIATCRWKMSRTLGLAMFALYFVFLILSVLLEDRVLICSVSI